MRLVWIAVFVVAFSSISFGQTLSDTVYEVDGVGQNGRPVTFGQVFKDGDITAGKFPQPQISGQSITSWQADCKNFYASTSPKFCVISYVQPTMASTTGYTVTFTSATDTCSSGCTGGTHGGGRTYAQLKSDTTTGASMVVTPAGGAAVTTSLSSILNASDPGSNLECQNLPWLTGPVVTAVIVQDCTSTSAFDFGSTWNGSTMATPVTGNDTHASFHPMFVLYDYPSISAVRVDFIIENAWTGRAQDQLSDIVFKIGATTKFSHVGARVLTDVVTTNGSNQITSATANFTSADVGLPIWISGSSAYEWDIIRSVTNSTTALMNRDCCQSGASGSGQTAYINLQAWGTSHRKTFWIGTAPGMIRIDHNFPYLMATGALPNHDTTNAYADPTLENVNLGSTSWSFWSQTTTEANNYRSDKGDIGGYGYFWAMTPDYNQNSEIAPTQREDLLYLFNMSAATSHDSKSCGDANSYCAKAWDMLTGEVGGIDSGLSAGAVVGGGGAWNNLGNVTFHARESRTTATGRISSGNSFYCDNFDPLQTSPGAHTGKNADPSNTTTCGSGAAGTATGKIVSAHAHSDTDSYGPGAPPIAAVGTISGAGWIVSNAHWLDYSYVPYLLTGDYWELEEVYYSSSSLVGGQNPGNCVYCANGFFGFANPNGSITRTTAGSIQSHAHAAYAAPDGTPESKYYNAMLASNLQVLEGFLNVTGTTLTPTDTTCSSNVVNYDYTKANRWNWGACTVRSACVNTGSGTCTNIPNALHMVAAGACPVAGDPLFGIQIANASATYLNWGQNALETFLGNARRAGQTIVAGVHDESSKQILEMVTDSTYNPYLIALGNAPTRDIASATVCDGSFGQNKDAFFSTYTGLASGALAQHTIGAAATITAMSCSANTVTVTATNNFANGDKVIITGVTPSGYNGTYDGIGGIGVPPNATGFTYTIGACPAAYVSGGIATAQPVGTLNFVQSVGGQPCEDHPYAEMARAAGSFLKKYNITSNRAGCSGGVCSPSTAWTWLDTNVPYFNNSPPTSHGCGVSSGGFNSDDQQVKWALAAESPGVTITACNSLSPSSATINTSATQNLTASCTYSDSSTGDCTSSLVLSSGSPSVATVSGQTATGISAGSSTISGTANSFACGNTSALTVTNPATQTIKITGGTSLSKGTILK